MAFVPQDFRGVGDDCTVACFMSAQNYSNATWVLLPSSRVEPGLPALSVIPVGAGQVSEVGTVLFIVGCRAGSLASTHWLPVASPVIETTKNVSGHCWLFLGRGQEQISVVANHWAVPLRSTLLSAFQYVSREDTMLSPIFNVSCPNTQQRFAPCR